jgi:hypothetical protein
MIKAPQWKDICDTARGPLTRDREATQKWWRDVQADPERRTNLFVLYGSYLLTAISIVGLLWLSGIFDLRGSNGHTRLMLIFSCGDPNTAEYKACKEAIDNSDQITALLDLQPRYDTQDTLDLDFGRAVPGGAKLFPTLTKATGIQVISTRAFSPSRYHAPKDARVTPIGGLWYSTLIRPVTSFGIAFADTVLLRYSGLSERDFSIDFDLEIGGSVLYGKKTLTLTLFPPVGFDVAEATPPAEQSSGGRAWTMRLESDYGEFLFRARLRNPATARNDHVSELVLSAVLGMAGASIVTAHINLWLIRGRRKSGT